jgi:hypothetical protein
VSGGVGFAIENCPEVGEVGVERVPGYIWFREAFFLAFLGDSQIAGPYF